MTDPYRPDQGDGTYTNPVIFADYSDPDLIRVGDDFWMVASSFHCMPGLPILHSTDLVNWTLVNHAVSRLPEAEYDLPTHGKGVWAPAIRYRDGLFQIYFPTPDEGIFVTTAADPRGTWSEPVAVHRAKGWIDPCPFVDDDGSVWLVNAFAKSRCGIKSMIQLTPLNAEGTSLDGESRILFDGRKTHPTIEGPKLYKREGFYYLFAPAGGVPRGWQTVLRATSLDGPWEDRIVLHQGDSEVNGPHQGALVDTQSGDWWFLHFQDRDAWGRIAHLQPVTWVDGWPQIGVDTNGDGIGEPVLRHPKPVAGGALAVPATSDRFSNGRFGLQWQWQANPRAEFLGPRTPGRLVLNAWRPSAGHGSLVVGNLPNLLAQKFPAPAFTVSTEVSLDDPGTGDFTGLAVVGSEHCCLALRWTGATHELVLRRGATPAGEPWEREVVTFPWTRNQVRLALSVAPSGLCEFFFAEEEGAWRSAGQKFYARPDLWVGAKFGVFCAAGAFGSRGRASVGQVLVAPVQDPKTPSLV